MKFGRDDTIIVKVGSKFTVGTAVGKTTIQLQGSDETLKFSADDLVAVVAPIAGQRVFGQMLLPESGTIKLARWDAKIIGPLPEADRKSLTADFRKAYDGMRGLGLFSGFPNLTRVTIMPKTKSFGNYKKKWAKDHWEDMLTLTAEPEYQLEAITNLLAHNVWHHMLNPELQAKWIARYDHIRAVQKASDTDLQTILGHYQDMAEPKIKGIHNELPIPDCDLLVNAILSHIRTHHKIGADDLDKLVIYQSEAVGRMWPASANYAATKATFPTYSLKSAVSMFGFAIYHKLFGTVPTSLEKAVASTIKLIAIKE